MSYFPSWLTIFLQSLAKTLRPGISLSAITGRLPTKADLAVGDLDLTERQGLAIDDDARDAIGRAPHNLMARRGVVAFADLHQARFGSWCLEIAGSGGSTHRGPRQNRRQRTEVLASPPYPVSVVARDAGTQYAHQGPRQPPNTNGVKF